MFNSLRTSMWKVKIRIAGMPQYVSTLISVQIFYDFALEVVLVFQWEVDQLGYFQAFTNRWWGRLQFGSVAVPLHLRCSCSFKASSWKEDCRAAWGESRCCRPALLPLPYSTGSSFPSSSSSSPSSSSSSSQAATCDELSACQSTSSKTTWLWDQSKTHNLLSHFCHIF